MSDLFRRLGQPVQAARRIEWLSEHAPEPARRRDALETLYTIYRTASDDERAEDTALRLARSHEQPSAIRRWYEHAGLRRWTPARLVDELAWHRTYRSTQWPAYLEALLSAWLSSERSPQAHQLGDELGHRWGEFRPPLALADLLALCRCLGPVETWGDSALAERYVGMSLAAFTTVTADERRDLVWILARRSGKERSTVHGILSDLTENGVRLGASALGTMLEALSEKPEAVSSLLKTLPRNARLRHPAAWLALLEEDVFERLRPEQQVHALVLLLNSIASEVEPGCLATMLPLVCPRLAEPEIGAAAEQVVPVLLERLDSLPREPLVELVSALTDAEHGPFSNPEGALATLQLSLELGARQGAAEATRWLAGIFHRLTATEAILQAPSVLDRVREALERVETIEPTTWNGVVDIVKVTLEERGSAALYLLALVAARAGRLDDAISYLHLALLECQFSGYQAYYVELITRTAKQLDHYVVPYSADLVEDIIRVTCCPTTWLVGRDDAKRWMIDQLGWYVLHPSPQAVARIVVDPDSTSPVIAAYLDARNEYEDCTPWVEEFLAELEARIDPAEDALDFERLEAVRRFTEPCTIRWKGSSVEQVWARHMLNRSIAQLRASGHFQRLLRWLERSFDKRFVAALVDLVPREWTGQRVESLARSLHDTSSVDRFRVLLDEIRRCPKTEFYLCRAMGIFLATRAFFPDDPGILDSISSFCLEVADGFSSNSALRVEALVVSLFCSSRLGRLDKVLTSIARRNPDIFREALEFILQANESWGDELHTIAAAYRAVEDWLQLCPPGQWKDPNSAERCIRTLHAQAVRHLPEHQVEPFLGTVLRYFHLCPPEGISLHSLELFQHTLEYLYDATGRPNLYGKLKLQLREET